MIAPKQVQHMDAFKVVRIEHLNDIYILCWFLDFKDHNQTPS